MHYKCVLMLIYIYIHKYINDARATCMYHHTYLYNIYYIYKHICTKKSTNIPIQVITQTTKMKKILELELKSFRENSFKMPALSDII